MSVSGAAGFVAFTALSGWLAARIGLAVQGTAELLVVLAAAPLALLVTDAISGLVHWVCDTYFEEDTPVLGPALIGPFREHHRDPLAMTRRPFAEVNASNVWSAVPVLLVALGVESSEGAVMLLLAAFAWWLAQAIAWTNQIHVWAHSRKRPLLVRSLQRARILISPGHHARHHAGGTGAYCITTGWLNASLDATQFFARLERGVAASRSAIVALVGLRQIGDQREDRAQERNPVPTESE